MGAEGHHSQHYLWYLRRDPRPSPSNLPPLIFLLPHTQDNLGSCFPPGTLSGFIALGKSFCFPEPQFPHLGEFTG